MSRGARRTAAWTALAILAGFIAIVFAVNRWGAELARINWPLVSILCGFAIAGVAIYQWNATVTRYNVVELLMNPKTGKPDPYRHLLFVFAGLAAWAIVQVVLARQWEQLTPLLGLTLGYFVAKPTVDGFADALGARRNAQAAPTAPASPVQD